MNNDSGRDYFVPLNSRFEWESFINNPPEGVTLANYTWCGDGICNYDEPGGWAENPTTCPTDCLGCGESFWGPDGFFYETVVAEDGRCWLDRNLGALRVATSVFDSQAFGQLYQWGRLRDGHEIINSETTDIISSNSNPGHADFIATYASPYNWIMPANNDLWQGRNGINNPCPTGFRLPTETELYAWVTDAKIISGTSAFESKLKLVLGGYRNASGALMDQGSAGSYWTSTPSSGLVRRLSFTWTGGPMFAGSFRALGSSVRCIKHDY